MKVTANQWNDTIKKGIEMKSAQIRGFRIEAQGDVMLKEMVKLYFAMKAHEGDPLAVEIMEAFGKEVKDADGKVIYAAKKAEK